jgi:hypothetical protein
MRVIDAGPLVCTGRMGSMLYGAVAALMRVSGSAIWAWSASSRPTASGSASRERLSSVANYRMRMRSGWRATASTTPARALASLRERLRAAPILD